MSELKDCVYCEDGFYRDVLGSPCKYNFCPMCGRPFAEPRKLTLDELRQMDGQPVYIKYLCESDEEDGWDIVNSIESRPLPNHEDFDLFVSFACGDGEFTCCYEKTWVAYDRPPGGERR